MAEKPVVMEGTVPEAKYQKLATEYSKVHGFPPSESAATVNAH